MADTEVLSQSVETVDAPAPEQSVEQAPQPELTAEAIDAMTGPEAEKVLADMKTGRTRGPDGKFLPKQAPAPTEQGNYIVVKDELGREFKFRNQEELNKSFAHAQTLLKKQFDELDGFRKGQGNSQQIRTQFEASQNRILELQNQIQQLSRGGQQLQQGQNPNAATQNALAPLQSRPGQNPMDLIYGEISQLKQDLLAERAANEDIRNGFRQREAEAKVQRGVEGLYSDAKNFQKSHPEFKTSESFDKLDDIISTYGEEVGKTMMSPEDYERYSALFQIEEMMYDKDQAGNLLIFNQKKFNDLDEAYLLYRHRNGQGAQDLVNAQKTGIANYEKVLQRTANSATTLPNNLTANQPPEMGQAEIEALFNMDMTTIMASPELTEKFNRACDALGQPAAKIMPKQ